MDPLLIVLIGTAVMVTGLVGFRLHAFLALILAAFVVCLLTPSAVRQQQALRDKALKVTLVIDGAAITVTPAREGPMPVGPVVLFQEDSPGVRELAVGTLSAGDPPDAGWRFAGEPALPSGRIEAGLASTAAWNAARARGVANPFQLVGEGFVATCAALGALILLASIIGECLTASGAAGRIVQWIQEQFGERRAPAALAGSAFLLGIPVFFDTVFYLLLPLGRGMALRTGRHFLLYTLSIVAGATMAHSLVPPTPGPLFAARAFGVPMGLMMVAGTLVGLVSVVVGSLYARWADSRWPIPVRTIGPQSGGDPSVNASAEFPPPPPPPLLLALLPIVLPVSLIAAAESCRAMALKDSVAMGVVRFLGQGSVALAVGTVAALFLLARSGSWRWTPIQRAVVSAIAGGGVILFITSAGGAFGAMLRQTDVASRLAQSAFGGGWGLLVSAFVVTALVRIAQGSATVAMLTAASVVAPVALVTDLPFHPVYLALAVGCGSKPVPWMNDSGFWIIGRMSGMTGWETLRTASVMMTLMGFAGFAVVLLGAWLLPLK